MREKPLLVTAAWVSLFAAQVPLVYSAAYSGLFETLSASVAGGILASLVLVAPAAACALFLAPANPTRIAAAATILYGLYSILQPYFLPYPLEWIHLAVLILGGAALVFSCLRFFGEAGWHRLARAVLAGMLAWLLSTPVIAWIQSDPGDGFQTTLSLQRLFDRPPKAVVILMLDEASPEVLPMLTAGLASPSHTLRTRIAEKAGSDTLNSISSMLTPQRHEGIVICGPTQLCGKTSLEFASLRAERAETDMVGFLHPYCAIRGLRSCWRANAKRSDHPTHQTDLITGLIGRIPLGWMAAEALGLESTKAFSDYTRKSVTRHALAAPFWTAGGGLLYIHQLLPHPAGDGGRRRLAVEYQANVGEARALIFTLKEQLQAHFQDDYAMIITADHPLRSAMWCAKREYVSPSCLAENYVEGDKVPLVVLAPRNLPVRLPVTNVGLFTPSDAF